MDHAVNRRDFLRQSAVGSGWALAGVQMLAAEPGVAAGATAIGQQETKALVMANQIGIYGPWAAEIAGQGPARLSFRNPQFSDLAAWRELARQRVRDRLLQPPVGPVADVRVDQQLVYDGLHVERLSWQLPYGPRTEAVLLKPAGVRGRLPAVLGLHDHGGNKFFGHPKITRIQDEQHPVMAEHQAEYYGGVAWANELAKRGYAVMVHDAYAFGSRRVRLADLSPAALGDVPLVDPDSPQDIQIYNAFAGQHEHLMAKSLFCAGTTWPGVFTVEDQRALDYLSSRPDVDPQRLGCGGLSGGGLRTVYLAGLDERIRCACCVGMMTTWRDYLLNTAHTHTWMIYIPGLPLDLDYPEILGARAPLPTLVLNNNEDALFTLPEMQRADQILSQVFAKADAAAAYRCSFYPGPHKFDLAMQQEAFDWYDRWLKA